MKTNFEKSDEYLVQLNRASREITKLKYDAMAKRQTLKDIMFVIALALLTFIAIFAPIPKLF